jgi:phage N-6-adenine-methyltransferase
MDEIHTSSKRSDWESPPALIADLETVFEFDLDVCASRPNVCSRFYSPQDNGLVQPWHGLCYMNPPYGRHQHIDEWTLKARMEAKHPGCTVVALLPARTGTLWWHSSVPYAQLCVFVKGRLRFHLPGGEPAPHSAGFPSALVAWGDLAPTQTAKLSVYGWAVRPCR